MFTTNKYTDRYTLGPLGNSIIYLSPVILLITIGASFSGAITTTSVRFTKENRLVILEYGVLAPLKVVPGVLVSRLRESSLITSSPESNYYVRNLVFRTIKVAPYINRIKSSKISSVLGNYMSK